MIGKTLGSVQVLELIARGGMAEVYLGEHTRLNRKVAVKIMREHVEDDPDNRARFEREAKVVAGLRHPNIIQVFDYEIIDGQPALMMEYVPGASLGTYLKALNKRGEKLPVEIALRILSMLASALDYAHAQHIIHRDIKPANVLLRSASGPIDPDQPLPADVEPVLTDFGLVRLLDSTVQTSTGAVSGTPAYMSPEQARGDKLDFHTDIYSLGVMLYEMLAGRAPFEAESSFGVLMKHLNEPPPPVPNASSDVQAVVNRALAKNAADRFDSAAAMMKELQAVFNGETISAETIRLAAPAPSQPDGAQRKFQWNYVFAGLLLLAFVLVGLRYWQGAPRGDESVGRVSFDDFGAEMDKLTLTISDLPAPKAGTHYEAWLLSQGGETRRNIGVVEMNKRQGALVFNNPNERNILEGFDQIEITVEPNNDPAPSDSSGEVVASSVFPPLALVHVRHLDVKFASAPNGAPLVSGLWYSADGLHDEVLALQAAYEKKDEAAFRAMNEKIINRAAGNQNFNQYKDWNGDGETDDASDGYGLLFNGEQGYTEQGYIPQTISHAQFAAQALDSTKNIKAHSEHVVVCAKNVEGWTTQLLKNALALQDMKFGAEMEPLLKETLTLASQIVSGADADGDELIEPVLGECGVDSVYEHAHYMSDMPLLPGAHRIPPALATKSK
ncbi:MAG: hypothetical protein Fur002_14350 [Anaerolineales bacterium]